MKLNQEYRSSSLTNKSVVMTVSLLIVILLNATGLLSCKTNTKGYVKYQTFDEYKLEGVGNFNIQHPYVLVKKEIDTIFVIKSNDKRNIIKYINKGEFWFYQETEKPQKGCCHKALLKKFITNDTIFIFSYFQASLRITTSTIIIERKEDKIVIGNDEIIF
jgi:hypothetical protein